MVSSAPDGEVASFTSIAGHLGKVSNATTRLSRNPEDSLAREKATTAASHETPSTTPWAVAKGEPAAVVIRARRGDSSKAQDAHNKGRRMILKTRGRRANLAAS